MIGKPYRGEALRRAVAGATEAIVAPMTTGGQQYPTRIPCVFQGKAGWVALDQIRTVNRTRLMRRLGRLDRETRDAVLDALAELFAP